MTRPALMPGSPIVVPLPVRRLFSRGSSSPRIFFGAVAGPTASMRRTPARLLRAEQRVEAAEAGIDLQVERRAVEVPAEHDHELGLDAAIQIRVATPATWPTVVIRGVKSSSDAPQLQASSTPSSPG